MIWLLPIIILIATGCETITCEEACRLEQIACSSTTMTTTTAVDGDTDKETEPDIEIDEKTLETCKTECEQNKLPSGCLECAHEDTCAEITDCYATNPRCETSQ